MYGLVNQAIEDLVCKNFGEDKWEQIKEKAKCTIPMFQSLESYDDKVTYDLVGAASEVLELPAEQVLEAFGKFWVSYTAQKGYENYFNIGGDNFKDFVLNLNLIHDKMEDIFPFFTPPKFEYEDVTDSSMTLLYLSKREGLAPMLKGLVIGLGEWFKIPIEVDYKPELASDKGEVFYLKF